MKSVPHDVITGGLYVMCWIPSVMEVFDPVELVVSEEYVVIPGDLISGALIDMMVGFATSKTFGVIRTGGKDRGWGDPSWGCQFGERGGWCVVGRRAGIGCSRAVHHRADIACCEWVFRMGGQIGICKFPK